MMEIQSQKLILIESDPLTTTETDHTSSESVPQSSNINLDITKSPSATISVIEVSCTVFKIKASHNNQ